MPLLTQQYQQTPQSAYRILFITAHPDDESLWVGGTLAAIGNMTNVHASVMCLTGRDDENRSQEFKQAIAHANLASSVLLPHPIPEKGGVPLEDIRGLVASGLAQLDAQLSDFDLVISHSHYGDEHTHHQHKQLFGACRRIAAEAGVPFGCFSFMPMPFVSLCPVLTDARRGFGLHFIMLAECELVPHGLSDKLAGFPPTHFIQFKVASEPKQSMLNCYQSINVEQHQQGYSAWDSFVEGFYLFDERGLDPFLAMYQEMERPFKPLDCIF